VVERGRQSRDQSFGPLGPFDAFDPLGQLDFVELLKRHPSRCRMPSSPRGFLSDSLRESPQEIGIADRPEAESTISFADRGRVF
jgi:hypothetical protein